MLQWLGGSGFVTVKQERCIKIKINQCTVIVHDILVDVNILSETFRDY